MFGESLRNARRARGLTQSELADRLGVTQPVISRWERGRNRPSPKQGDALKELLGVAEPGRSVAASPVLRPVPAREPDRLPLPVEVEFWQRPEMTGDFVLCSSLPRDDVLLAVVDTVGRGPAAALAAQHLRGWLYGWIASRGVAVRLDDLVLDMGAELRASRLDASWFFAVLGRAESPHTVRVHMASQAFPAPLLFEGPRQRTLPTRAEEVPGQGPANISYVRFEGLEAPWRLVVATDGLLARLGAGDERRGKRTILRWKSGVAREVPPDEYLRGGEAADDETLAQLRWSSWDVEQELDAASGAARHRLLESLGMSARDHWRGRVPIDRIVIAVNEALSNLARHAYSDSGPATVRWRHTHNWTQVEVGDEGVGGPIEEQGGFRVMRHHADVVHHWESNPTGKTVFLAFQGVTKDEPE